MHRLIEIIFGLEPGFLSREGELSLHFAPRWPETPWINFGWGNWPVGVLVLGLLIWSRRYWPRRWWTRALWILMQVNLITFFFGLLSGAPAFNLAISVAAAAILLYTYRREGRPLGVRLGLGAVRAALFTLLILLLNNPMLTLGQSRTEPSVVAVMIDDSISMRVRDAGNGPDGKPLSRLEAVEELLADHDKSLLKELSKTHQVRLFKFDGDKEPLDTAAIAKLQPQGQNTQVLASLKSVLSDMQGQRLAGVIVLSDGRETPARPIAEGLAALKEFSVKVYPVAVGSDKAPSNIEVQSIAVQDSAFKDDIVNVKATVRATGYEPGHVVSIVLKDKKTGKTLASPDGKLEQRITLANDQPTAAELQFKPTEVGTLDLIVEAIKQPGEVNDDDNARPAQIAVLDAKLSVLYVEGPPRWEYRYIKNEMIRDKTIDISCLLTSADPSFAQEGDKPIKRFPESIEELMEYDVILFGDVDPRQFSDSQLQLVNDFVNKRGGGFGMIAGQKYSPQAFRNTAIEPILPVVISRVEADSDSATITQGFRPILTKEGQASSIFRFFADKTENEKFFAEGIQPLYWYCHGVMTKPGTGEVYATHPTDVGPDGRKAPLLVLGRFGAGRTLFSAIDDSWRWRFYTGESVFDTYWIQQVRYLARSKKLGQRRLTFAAVRPQYEIGDQVRLNLRILDPALMQQLPEQIRVEVQDQAGQVVRHETLIRQEGQSDLYVAAFTADRTGEFTASIPPVAGGVDGLKELISVTVPGLELSQPQVDRTFLSRLSAETLGQTVDLTEAAAKLPPLIQSAAKVIPIETSRPVWDAPLALFVFVFLITVEWIVRKMFGMV